MRRDWEFSILAPEEVVQPYTELELRALALAKGLGMRRAAGFLRNRGVPLEDALRLLSR